MKGKLRREKHNNRSFKNCGNKGKMSFWDGMKGIKFIRFFTPLLHRKLGEYLMNLRPALLSIYQYWVIFHLIKGIIISRNTFLTGIARVKYIEKGKIKNTVKSLSRALKGMSEKIDMVKLWFYYSKSIPFPIGENTIIIADFSDVAKGRGKAFEALDRVHDGSSMDGRIEKGYWILSIIAYIRKSNLFIPLVLELYSLKAGDVVSQNKILFENLRRVMEMTNYKGIYIFDRGFDDKKLMNLMGKVKYIICGQHDRESYVRGKRYKLNEYIKMMNKSSLKKVSHDIMCKREKSKVRLRVNVGYEKIRLKEVEEEITLVTSYDNIRGTRRYFYTSYGVSSEYDALKIVELYLYRWKIEEFLQFIKMNQGIEKFRVRKYKVIKLLIFLSMVAFMFLFFLCKTKDERVTSFLFALSQNITDKLTINGFAKGLSKLFEWIVISQNLFGLKLNYEV